MGDIVSKNKSDSQTISEYFASDPYVECFLNDMDLVDKCWDTYNDCIASNPPDSSSNGIESWFKYEEDVNSITICARTQVKSEILPIISVFAEFDFLPVFINSFEGVDIIKQLSNFRFLTRERIKMPMFLQNRELVTIAMGIPSEDENSLLMPFKSVTQTKYLDVEIPPEDPNYCRIEMNFGFYLLTCIDKETTELVVCFNIDPKIHVIPWFIINTFIKEVSYYIVLGFRERIENMSGSDKALYENRRLEKKDFYDVVEKKIHKIDWKK